MTTTPPKKARRLTVPQFVGKKAEGQRISMLTAYDFTQAALVDAAGVDGILVGDSMSMVVQGHDTTLPVTMEEIIYHAEMVGRAVNKALVVVDMPFPSFHLGIHKAIENAGRLLKESRCQAVKLESSIDQADVIGGMVTAGIPVMAHVGLRPQTVHQLGGYKVQRDEERLMAEAVAAADAGAFAVLMECVPASIAAKITERLSVPTIGIGAGIECDGQILVLHDLIGMTLGRVPRFAKQYANVGESIQKAVQQFTEDVRDAKFPGDEQVIAK